jgi:hypothetical protein
MAIFAAIWTLFIGVFDVVCVRSIVTHGRTGTYASTEGLVVASRVTNERRTSDGDVPHGVAIEYTYAVDGKSYRGTRYRGAATSQSGSWASEIVGRFPVGAHVPVFYAPGDPSDAVLSAGLDGGDGFFPLFLLPFNAVALALWASARRAARRDAAADVTGGLRVVEERDVVRVLPDALPPAGAALFGAGLTAFVLVFAVAFPFGFDPPGLTVALAWAAIVLVAALSYARAVARRASGVGDLVIDAMSRTLRFPLGRKVPREPVAWSEIESVVIETLNGRSGNSHWVSMALADGERVRLRSKMWDDRNDAERFRSWLEARLRVSN